MSFTKLRIVLEMIKFEHTIFALPFALLGAILAARGLPSFHQLAWIIVAVIGARSAAMAFNRLVDAPFDAANPRTANRAVPKGLLTYRYVIIFVVVSAAIFVFSAYQLNRLAFMLSPLALLILLGYSYLKRFTYLTHVFLGVSLAGAPVGAWIAIRGDLTLTPLLLGIAVTLWVGGFDIIYACQDADFDRKAGLQSLPGRFGVSTALRISILFHVLTVLFLAIVIYRSQLGWVSYLAVFIVSLLLYYEHHIVRPDDLSRVNTAFFTINGCVSILFFLMVAADLLR